MKIFFSIVQRKVIKPGDFADLNQLAQRLLAFQDRYNAIAEPFDWHFGRRSLNRLLERLAVHEPLAASGGRQSRHASPRVISGRSGVRACLRRPAAMFVWPVRRRALIARVRREGSWSGRCRCGPGCGPRRRSHHVPVRREVLLFRMEVEDLRRCPCRSRAVELRAARSGRCRGGWEQP